MKKVIFSLILAAAMLAMTVLPSFATQSPELVAVDVVYNDDGSTVTYFDDGSYLTVSAVQTSGGNMARGSVMPMVTASRTVTYTNGSGVDEWEYELTAVFSYIAGVSATCQSSIYNKTIKSGTFWSFSNGAATKSGNTAYGVGRFSRTITGEIVNIDISLKCDANGYVS